MPEKDSQPSEQLAIVVNQLMAKLDKLEKAITSINRAFPGVPDIPSSETGNVLLWPGPKVHLGSQYEFLEPVDGLKIEGPGLEAALEDSESTTEHPPPENTGGSGPIMGMN